ncbi:MAG: glycosyltransferase family 1 protein [Desulfarculus sp.]|nr:MAG: glycosyltransferase family 1 protein [Desulfarculus sp.]
MRRPLVLDARALQPGFKQHLQRGIGRYARNLLTALLDLVDQDQLTLIVRRDLPDPGLAPKARRWPMGYAPAWLPAGRKVVGHHLLARRALAPLWGQGRVVHFLSHVDAPFRIGPGALLTCHDLIFQRLPALYTAGQSRLAFRLKRWLETRALFQAARIIAVSRCTAEDLRALYGIAPERIAVIPEAADPGLAPVADPAARAAALARHGLEPGAPFFFYLGGLDPRKGLSILLEALLSWEEAPPPLLAVAGPLQEDQHFPAFQREIERRGLGERVRLLGFVAEADLPALFSAATAFVFPSLYEGFGLPPLEAMACGAPVIAARAAAVPEVVGQAGILVPPGDPAALAAAMAEVLRRPELAAELRAQGLKRAAQFSWRRAAERTHALYEEVAAEL